MSNTQIKDGGPAFPLRVHMPYKKGGWDTQLPGMSLRDWFAGQALAMLADSKVNLTAEELATCCYQNADAMLAAREVKP